jgi:HK97 family phage prohead protease
LSVIRFDADASLITAEAGDAERPARIAGIAVPWDTVATVSDGQQVRFARGAFDTAQKPAKLIENHDLTQLRGVVNALQDTDEGLEFEATLADTRASRDAVALLKAGAYDSVSVGAQPTKFTTDAEGVMTVTEAALVELSLVAVPAFKEAVITQVAATEPADAEPEQEQDTENTEQENQEMSEAKIEAEPIEAEATIPTQPFVYAAAKPKMPTAVEYLTAYFKGGSEFDKVQQAIHAAAPEVGTADTPGILPTPILGPAYNGYVGTRPVCDAIGVRAMPGGGKVFIRPKVVTHTSMGGQSAEFDTLTQGTFVVDDIQVTKATYGGYVNISEQDLDWTDPAVLNLILEDMGRIYAATTENVAADNLVSGSTNTQAFGDEPADLSDPAKWSTWIAEAAKDVVSNSDGNLPTHLFVSPDIWGYLLSLSDTADRPLFPQLGPMNAVGQLGPQTFAGNAFGLSVVVSRWFANLTLIMGNADGYEIYEQQKGAITTDNPTELSRTLAWRGYFATCMLDAGKFVKATFT